MCMLSSHWQLYSFIIVRNQYNPRPYVSQARTYIDMHDFQMRGHMFERRGTHAHIVFFGFFFVFFNHY